jgi:isoprenylcysteine carboxyl methyltransferase (ICMT) family protein YpbQ
LILKIFHLSCLNEVELLLLASHSCIQNRTSVIMLLCSMFVQYRDLLNTRQNIFILNCHIKVILKDLRTFKHPLYVVHVIRRLFNLKWILKFQQNNNKLERRDKKRLWLSWRHYLKNVSYDYQFTQNADFQ